MEPTGITRKTDLGKIMPLPKENNLSSYDILDIIVTDGRAYMSRKRDNKAAVTDAASWLKITENTYDIAVRLGLFTGTEAQFVGAVTSAITAATNATSAATYANQVGQKVEAQSAELTELLEKLQARAKELEEVIKAGQEQTDSIRALEESITNYVQSAPTRMELSYLDIITLGNPNEQRIEAKLYPAYVLQNVLYLPADGQDVLTVYPDGALEIHKAGTATVHVIPTHNVALYKTIKITVQEPAMLLTSGGAIRLNADGNISLT